MPLIIKINEPRNSETLELDHVRPGYIFRWDEKHRAYVYHPKNQAEIDSIFDAQRIYRKVWTFIPLVVDGPASAAPKSATELAHEAATTAELERVNGLLTAATKRIADLKAEHATADGKSAARIAELEAAFKKLKGEYDKVSAAAAALAAAPEPAKKPATTARGKAAPAAQPAATPPPAVEPAPVATDDELPPTE